jgi:hypothetical protein
VAANASLLAPYSAAFKAELLGDLDPSMWELSVLMPIQPPITEAKRAEKQLKASQVCRCAHAPPWRSAGQPVAASLEHLCGSITRLNNAGKGSWAACFGRDHV